MTRGEKKAFDKLCKSFNGYVQLSHNMDRYKGRKGKETYVAYQDSPPTLSNSCLSPMEAVDKLLSLSKEKSNE